MAIVTITKPFSILKLLRSKPNAAASPGREEIATPTKVSCKEDEFRQAFSFLDTDNDGRISADELKAYFTSVGDSLSKEEAEKIIGELSEGGGDDIEFEEFVHVMELHGDGDILRRAFGVYEEEKGSGCITAAGLRSVLRRLGVVKTVEECKAMIRVYDLDGNGVLDFYEFYKMMS